MRDRMWEIKQEGMLSKWAELIAEQEGSGQGVASWCAEQGINRNTYHHWLNKVKTAGVCPKKAGGMDTRIVCEESSSEFVRISLRHGEREDEASSLVPAMRIMIGEASCEIYAGADPGVVGRAIGALAASL